MEYVYKATTTDGSTTKYTYLNDSTGYTATIKLLDNVANGKPFGLGGSGLFKADSSEPDRSNGLKKSNITIDLNGKTYNFTESLVGSYNSKTRAIRIEKAEQGSKFVIKNGTLTTSDRLTGSDSSRLFNQMIRSYADLELNNVKIDATNLKGQYGGEEGAAVQHTLGTLTLSGSTEIVLQSDNGDDIYYAVGGKRTEKDETYKGNLSIVVNLDKDGYIPNIGLAQWADTRAKNENDYYKGSTYSSTTFEPEEIGVTINSGRVGEITLDGVIVDKKGYTSYSKAFKFEVPQTVASAITNTASGKNISLGADAASSVTFGLFNIPTTGTPTYLIYQKDTVRPYTLGIEGWNKQTVDDAGEYNYIAPSLTASGTADSVGRGEIILNVQSVDDTKALAFDKNTKTFGIPVASTAVLKKNEDYKLASLRYNSAGDAVTISSANEGAALFSGEYSLTAGSEKSTGILSDKVKTINASDVSVAVSILGNSLGNVIYDGAGSNYISLGSGSDTISYGGGSDSITNYTAGKDVIKLVGSNITPVTEGSGIASVGNDLILGFGNGTSINFKENANIGNGEFGAGVSVESGNKSYIYTYQSIVQDYAVTLTSAASITGYNVQDGTTYYTIDGSAVTHGLALTGGGDKNSLVGALNVAVDAANKVNSLDGGAGDDTLKGGNGADVFVYSTNYGKDIIENYDSKNDKLDLDEKVVFTGVKSSGGKLTFSTNNSKNALIFNDVDADTRISLNGGGYLTKDGRVNIKAGDGELVLFSTAKGTIDVNDGTYSDTNISKIDASAVKQALNFVASSVGGEFQLAGGKKKDTFVYGGGSVTINGYEANTDKLDFSDITISKFEVDASNVSITAGTSHIIINNAANQEVLIRQEGSNSFKKKVFVANNVLADKKNPTQVTVFAGATEYSAENAPTVKKITIGSGATNVSVTAGRSNTTFNASEAGSGVSLISGRGNDKFTGSGNADTFIYTAGKDVIQDYDYTSNDKISLSLSSSAAGTPEIYSATKISKSNSQVKLTFGKSSNVLTVKGKDLKTLKIDGAEYAFGKNAIIADETVEGSTGTKKVAKLTSEASGNVKVTSFGSEVDEVDATAVTKKNLTLTGTKEAEVLIAGGKKTTLKGSGGDDTLIGGSGKDTFLYEKGKDGDVTIQNFDFSNDTLKIANGTIAKEGITVEGGRIKFSMTNGKKNSTDTVGTITVASSISGSGAVNITDTSKVAIKANNTYYWFATNDDKDDDENVLTGLVTAKSKVTASQINSLGFTNIIDLNYSTNLVKSGVAKQSNRSTSTTS